MQPVLELVPTFLMYFWSKCWLDAECDAHSFKDSKVLANIFAVLSQPHAGKMMSFNILKASFVYINDAHVRNCG